MRFAPTFLVVETAPDGALAGATERRRMEGYPGEDMFRGYVDAVLADALGA